MNGGPTGFHAVMDTLGATRPVRAARPASTQPASQPATTQPLPLPGADLMPPFERHPPRGIHSRLDRSGPPEAVDQDLPHQVVTARRNRQPHLYG